MSELADTENYLDSPRARNHQADWYRERLLVFVPDVDDQQGGGGDQPKIVEAVHSVVSVVEASFLEVYQRLYAPMVHYVCVGSALAGNSHKARISDALKKFSEQEGRLFLPRFHDSMRTDNRLGGTFLGAALFVGRENEHPRGYVAIEIAHRDDAEERYEARANFSDSDSQPAAFFQGQDRMVGGFDPGLPIVFRIDSNRAHLLDSNKLLLILPTTIDSIRPRLVISTLARGAAALLAASPNVADEMPQLNSIVPLFSSSAPENETLSEIAFDDETQEARVSAKSCLASGASDYRATVRIVPNDAECRLRHAPPRGVDNWFSIIGLLLPSPVADNEATEVCINLRNDGQLLAHPLDALAKCILLRPSRGWKGKVFGLFGSLDEAILADQLGLNDIVELNKRMDFESVGENHRIALLSARQGLNFKIQNPFHSKTNQGFLSAFGNRKDYYLFQPRDDTRVLGYMASPTRHSYDPETEEAGSDTRRRRSTVRFSRSAEPLNEGVCLDWLDEAVQITHLRPGARARPEMIGLAQYWNEQRVRIHRSTAARQTLELYRDHDMQPYDLTLLESLEERDDRVRLLHNDVIRLGPLICRYNNVPAIR